jgi:hypothetical protein
VSDSRPEGQGKRASWAMNSKGSLVGHESHSSGGARRTRMRSTLTFPRVSNPDTTTLFGASVSALNGRLTTPSIMSWQRRYGILD